MSMHTAVYLHMCICRTHLVHHKYLHFWCNTTNWLGYEIINNVFHQNARACCQTRCTQFLQLFPMCFPIPPIYLLHRINLDPFQCLSLFFFTCGVINGMQSSSWGLTRTEQSGTVTCCVLRAMLLVMQPQVAFVSLVTAWHC